jgi:hypothetical protein
MLFCLVLMAIGMFLRDHRHSARRSFQPTACSPVFGIGGMLAATNAVVFEMSSRKHRAAWQWR